ncbi:MAG TPA: ABC transporter ATP-binding protein [Methylomirabilota bacterium]|jgi:branched-chain amino acid transport system ATP-binding protein
MLDVERLEVAYGDATALWDVSLTVGERELVSVIGPNGSGKTTLINAIAGLLLSRGGRLRFQGEDLTRLAPHEVSSRGIAIVPEGRRLFTGMTVEENLEIGCYAPGARPARMERLARVYGMFPLLRARRRQAAGTLSGGEQQMVAIGRALMAGPRLLLLDEPSLGLAPAIVDQVFDVVEGLHRTGTAVLLVEQSVERALRVATRAYVLAEGRIVSGGTPAQLLREPHIRSAYLGEGEVEP